MFLPTRSTLLPVLTMLPALAAQSTRTFPGDAASHDVAGFVMPGIDASAFAFRWQQAWNAARVAPVRATLQQIEFRADGGLEFADAFVGTQLGNVVLRLSVERYLPDALSTSFAGNVQSPQTTVFSGNLSLPARGAITPNTPSPWFAIPLAQPHVAITAGAGTLLMDMTGNGIGHGGPRRSSWAGTMTLPYVFDAGNTASVGAAVRSFGTSSAGVLTGSPAFLGGRVQVSACGSGAYVVVGPRRALPAIDLTPLGAP
jgi:hypothetical protein